MVNKEDVKVGDKVILIDDKSMGAEVGATAIVKEVRGYLEVEWCKDNGLCHYQGNGGYSYKIFDLLQPKQKADKNGYI